MLKEKGEGWKVRKNLLWISLIALLILSVLSINTIRVFAGEYPAIYIEPATTVDESLTPGSSYTISIKTDCTGNDITSHQFTLRYNPNILHGVSVANGDLVTTEKDPSAQFIAGTFDNVAGELPLTGAFFYFIDEPAPTTSGPGTLANVTFTVVGIGTSNITLGSETKLIGYTEGINPGTGEMEPGWGDPYKIIYAEMEPEHIQHGYFINVQPIHDVAVVDVTSSPSRVTVGELVSINVTVVNQGTETENFSITAYYDNVIIGTESVTNLSSGASETLTFDWETTDVGPGVYTIKAVASTVTGEIDTANNEFIDDTVTITVQETPALGILLYVAAAGVAAIIIVAIAFYFLRARKPA